ncbi:MAG: patatin [Desulfobacterales bacterium SG8_35_2]|nr:MAG: patatin [Desulfobacterales bacterium SG8_35_2]
MKKINYDGRIGLALGSGASRGWSHIGIIKALTEIGIEPEIISGCSIGALVGASYCAGKLDKLEDWLTKVSKMEVVKFLELNWSLNGFVDKKHLNEFLINYVCNEETRIEKLEKIYAAVATDLNTGREVWFTKNSLLKAVMASISLPGLFPPIRYEGKWLVDGGLVNPVPISICRALGADIVIAVNLNGDIVGKHLLKKEQDEVDEDDQGLTDRFMKSIKKYSETIFSNDNSKVQSPGFYNIIATSINIFQDRITRSRMAGDPPEVLLTPQLSKIGLLEFDKGIEALNEGKACVNRMQSEIEYALSK